MKKNLTILALTATCACLAVTSARANTITLNTGNSALSGNPGPYGSVIVTLVDSTDATIEFKSNPGFVLVDGSANDFNLNGSATITISSVTPSSVSLTSAGSGNVGSFGTFNTTYTSGSSSPAGRFTDAVYSLHLTSGTWSSDANILSPNSDGNLVAAHIGVGGLTGDLAVTGFATAGPNTVPDGGTTVLLLGAALSGLGLIRRKLS